MLGFNGYVPAQIKRIDESPIPFDYKEFSQRAINVKWFGAKGDGVTDDTAAIQNAIDNANNAIIFIPEGRYLINKPLNVTNKSGIIIIGSGEYQTILIGNTGNTVFDLSGTYNSYIGRLTITNKNVTNPSTIGIFFARSQVNNYVERNKVEDIFIDFLPIGNVNNGNGTIGIYNFASEIWTAINIRIIADKPIIFTRSNIYELQSIYTPILPDGLSMSLCNIYSSVLHAMNGPAITFDNVFGMSITNSFLNASYNSYQYAMRVCNGYNRSINFDGVVENFPRVIIIDDCEMKNLNINAEHYPSNDTQILLYSNNNICTLQESVIRINTLTNLSDNPPNHLLIDHQGPNFIVHDCIFFVGYHQNINLPVNADGIIVLNNSNNQVISFNGYGLSFERTGINFIGRTQTSATNGSASSLPQYPAGYLKVKINGTDAVIPYYLP